MNARVKLTVSFLLTWFLCSAAFGQTTGADVKEFESDGCSLFPEGNYLECCVKHDEKYFRGGSFKERRAADKELYKCVRAKGNGKFLASMIYIGVRVGGVHFLPTPFRWGFGNKFPHKEPAKPNTGSSTDH